MPFSSNIKLLTSQELHQEVIQEAVLCAERYVWIATANLKNLHLPSGSGKYESIVNIFSRLCGRGVELRLLHSALPSRSFREFFDASTDLVAPYDREKPYAVAAPVCQGRNLNDGARRALPTVADDGKRIRAPRCTGIVRERGIREV